MRALTQAIVYAAAALAVAACSQSGAEPVEEALVTVGSSSLTRAELDAQIPGGLSEEDSVKFARAYIRSWIDSKIVSEIAAGEIDMTDIDRMVEEYRSQLIMYTYSNNTFEARNDNELPEDSIRGYYDQHKDEFVLDAPMVKGVYLKVPEDYPGLDELRRLIQSTDPEDIEALEKTALDGAVHYDYFRDRWIDWKQIEALIPYEDNGMSDDRFLNANRHIDITSGGFTYLLDINDLLHTGQTMPYDVASTQIQDRIRFQQRRLHEQAMRQELYDRGVSNGTIKLNCQLE